MEAHIELIARITAGEMDNHFSEIKDAIKNRQSVIGLQKRRLLSAGDEVAFAPNINPKYLVGGTAEVVKVLQKNVTVKILTIPNSRSTSERFRVGQIIRCPLDLLVFEDPNEAARKIVEQYADSAT